MIRTITPMLSILVAILIFIFVVKPNYNDILHIRTEIEAYKHATEQYAVYNSAVDSLKLIKNSTKLDQRQKLDALVPKTLDDSHLLVDLEQIIIRNNLLLGRVNAANDKNSKPVELGKDKTARTEETDATNPSNLRSTLSTLDVTFDVMGSYSDFKNFLEDIEKSVTLMEVTNISFKNNEEGFNLYTVTVRTYGLPEGNN